MVGREPILVTYCPLCNTATVYRRTVDGQVLDFGTTGVLRFSNLVMYDRQTESWWQEVTGEAVVGELTGRRLEVLPNSIVAWEEFKRAHPGGMVLSRDTGFDKPYGQNPYYRYDTFGGDFMYDVPEDKRDGRLPFLERVVGIVLGEESMAVPYSALETESVVHITLAGQELVVFFKKGTASALDTEAIIEGRDVGSAGVFYPNLEGRKLTFTLEGEEFVDDQTGSAWNLLGQATSGPFEGEELSPVVHQGGQIWFTWVVFRPNTVVYRAQ